MSKRKKYRDQDGIFERPDSPYWWASWSDASGKPTRRSTGVRREDDPRKERAKTVRAKWLLDVQAEKQSPMQPQPQGPTFDDLMVRYIDGPSLEKNSHERDLHSLKPLAKVFMGRELATINGSDVRQYIAERKKVGIAPATINREIGLASAAINWARCELEWVLVNPFQGRRQAEPPGRERWLSREEADLLIKTATGWPKADHLVDFIRLGLFTGMRSGEILGLEWSRVDIDRNLIYLGAKNQKNKKAGSVPINQSAREALEARARFRSTYCPDSPWVFCNKKGERIANIKHSFSSVVSKCGLKDVHPHDLRRTFGSWLVQQGVPIHSVSALLRHSDIQVTVNVYAHLAPENLKDAAGVLDEVSRSGFTLDKIDRETACK